MLGSKSISNMTAIKPYNIEETDSGSVEITMYGEVVESVPIDWWTGEPVDGLFICLSDFLNDLAGLNGKNITIRINSVGGDLEAGVAIYHRLRDMDNVTTIVDGLAASAASIIAQAGKTRKVYPASQMMIHSASVWTWEPINMAKVKELKALLESANKQVVAVYADRSGQTATKLKHMVEETTWMVGQEIIDAGLADEMIDGDEVKVSISADHRVVFCNGIPMRAGCVGVLPKNMTKHTGAVPDVIDQSKKEEVKVMTVEELKAKYPDAVTEIEEAARASVDVAKATAEATEAERKRIEDIESIEASVKDKELVRQAKYGDKPMDAKDLALLAMQSQAKEEQAAKDEYLADSAKDSDESGAKDVVAAPAGDDEDKDKDVKDIALAVKAFNESKGGRV